YLMRALSEKQLSLTPTVVKHFDQCLGCMGCMTACPSGVKYDALIEETRFEIERSYQRPWAHRRGRAGGGWRGRRRTSGPLHGIGRGRDRVSRPGASAGLRR
uniref:4Fe-4S dicluster domain-containing protein n=1 Tax=uncultured Jatrophihabitans sp. TaxID=1610747 RepID=UPI0035CB684F